MNDNNNNKNQTEAKPITRYPINKKRVYLARPVSANNLPPRRRLSSTTEQNAFNNNRPAQYRNQPRRLNSSFSPSSVSQNQAMQNNFKKAITTDKPNKSKRSRRSTFDRSRPARKPAQAKVSATTVSAPKKLKIPEITDKMVRIIPLGGVEEVGRNMTIVETKDDIVIIDCGFQFEEENTPGIDYIIPNTQYLEERIDKIRGVLVTHAHLDHIGAIPFVFPRIGNPTIYTRFLTSLMIKKRQTEFPHLPELNIQVLEKNTTLKLGNLTVRLFSVSHSIPDSMGLIIETAWGDVVTPGDFKVEHLNSEPTEREKNEYKIFAERPPLLLLAESTNIENPGFSTPESLVHQNLENLIRDIKGRLVIGTFASQFERTIKIIKAAENLGKKIVLIGRSMSTNVEIAQQAKLLEIKKETIISDKDVANYPADRIVILATGAQGEDFAGLMRLANKTHPTIHLNDRDTVILSSSVIPGNEKAVQKLKDTIARCGAKIVHYRTSDVYIHSSGHANYGELEWLHKQTKPKFFIPIHGHHYNLRLHAQLAESLGQAKANIIIPDDLSVIDIEEGKTIHLRREKAGDGLMVVDGFSVGSIQEAVVRDRQTLADDGFFIVVANVNLSTGKLKKSPDIISRGFIYFRESQDLLNETRDIIRRTIERNVLGQHPVNFDLIKDEVAQAVEKHIFSQTAKRPIVIPVVLGV